VRGPDGRIREELVARLGTKGALRCWGRGVMDLGKDANATGFV
jgi:hypothetical protein